MVEVAVVGGDVAARWVCAASIADLDGSTDGAVEGAGGGDGHDGAGSVEEDGLDIGVAEMDDELGRRDDDATAEFAESVEALFADEHGDSGRGRRRDPSDSQSRRVSQWASSSA